MSTLFAHCQYFGRSKSPDLHSKIKAQSQTLLQALTLRFSNQKNQIQNQISFEILPKIDIKCRTGSNYAKRSNHIPFVPAIANPSTTTTMVAIRPTSAIFFGVNHA